MYNLTTLSGATHRSDKSRAYVRSLIKRGAKWLDENKPFWRNIIDLKTLDMVSPNYCIFGQNFDVSIGFILTNGEVDTLSEITGVKPERPALIKWLQSHGFLSWESEDMSSWHIYNILDDQWRRELKKESV